MTHSTMPVCEGEVLARFVHEAMKETVVAPRAVPPATEVAVKEAPRRSLPGTVLLVRVGGIAAAVPLSDIAGIERYAGARPRRMSRHGRDLRVVAPGQVLGGADINDDGYLLICAGTDLVLPCDGLEGSRELGDEDYRLRRASASRPWVSGVINDEVRCLLHLPALSAALAEEDGTEAASDSHDAPERQISDTNRPTENTR